jgi:hypothetical protein
MRFRLIGLALTLLFITRVAAQEGNPAEPEYSSVFYFLRSGQLVDLERQSPDQFLKGSDFLLVIQGEKSTVRLSANESMKFVVRVTEDYAKAVASLQLVRFESQNGKRQLRSKRKDFVSNKVSLAVNAEKYGRSSLLVVPYSRLLPGEYCISRTTVMNGYCFGVDAAQN